MRCEDCLPLIEEYFDKETDARTSEQMSAHLSTCADCAAALDSLSFEQEIYARYDRPVEVTPSLWASVSAEIARGPQPEHTPPARQKFLSRLRDGVAVSLAALALRPALASTLALLVVAAAAGSLWLAHVRRADTQREPSAASDLASKSPTGNVRVTPSPDATELKRDSSGPAEAASGNNPDGEKLSPPESGRDREPASASGIKTPGGRSMPVSVEALLAYQPAKQSGLVEFRPVDHERAETDPTATVQAASFNSGDATAGARLLDPEQKDLARHVEQAQILLRSIKNARPSDGDTVNISYEKKLSRKLLAENATLQLDAETRGDRDTQQVLDSIEPFLLDIANMHDNASREEVRSVKERVKKTEIIAALQVY